MKTQYILNHICKKTTHFSTRMWPSISFFTLEPRDEDDCALVGVAMGNWFISNFDKPQVGPILTLQATWHRTWHSLHWLMWPNVTPCPQTTHLIPNFLHSFVSNLGTRVWLLNQYPSIIFEKGRKKTHLWGILCFIVACDRDSFSLLPNLLTERVFVDNVGVPLIQDPYSVFFGDEHFVVVEFSLLRCMIISVFVWYSWSASSLFFLRSKYSRFSISYNAQISSYYPILHNWWIENDGILESNFWPPFPNWKMLLIE